MQYTMFNVMKDIRGLELADLRSTLYARLIDEAENFTNNSDYHEDNVGFHVHQQNRFFVHCILARMTDFITPMSLRMNRISVSIGTELEVYYFFPKVSMQATETFPMAKNNLTISDRIYWHKVSTSRPTNGIPDS